MTIAKTSRDSDRGNLDLLSKFRGGGHGNVQPTRDKDGKRTASVAASLEICRLHYEAHYAATDEECRMRAEAALLPDPLPALEHQLPVRSKQNRLKSLCSGRLTLLLHHMGAARGGGGIKSLVVSGAQEAAGD